MFTIETDRGETALPLELSVSRLGTGGVTGLVPTVAVRRVSSGTPSYLDFGDSSFKTAGWAIKYAPMVEIERGHYQFLLNVSLLSVAGGSKLVAEYHVDGGGDVRGDDSDLIFVLEEEPEEISRCFRPTTSSSTGTCYEVPAGCEPARCDPPIVSMPATNPCDAGRASVAASSRTSTTAAAKSSVGKSGGASSTVGRRNRR